MIAMNEFVRTGKAHGQIIPHHAKKCAFLHHDDRKMSALVRGSFCEWLSGRKRGDRDGLYECELRSRGAYDKVWSSEPKKDSVESVRPEKIEGDGFWFDNLIAVHGKKECFFARGISITHWIIFDPMSKQVLLDEIWVKVEDKVSIEGVQKLVESTVGTYVPIEYCERPRPAIQIIWDELRKVKHARDMFSRAFIHAVRAHNMKSVEPRKCFRKHDMRTPMHVHPTWCAMTLMHETSLSYEARKRGALALQLHDVLEDTTAGLPDGTPEEVEELVNEMTFDSYGAELDSFWKISKEAQLLKLYDKVSNLMDGSWMSPEKRTIYVCYTRLLAQKARENYGELNIVKIAEAICS
jgi:hypothetical protein